MGAGMMARRGARNISGLGACILMGLAAPALAHPHVFIDTGLEIAFDDQGRAAVVQVVWVYDEFYSMVAIADYGLDADFTGHLTEAERAELTAIYSNWQPGYEGDFYPEQGGLPLALSAPFDFFADYREGRIIVSHRRRIDPPVSANDAPLVLKVYDPSYYTAYTIAAAPQVTGDIVCDVSVLRPDFSHAEAQLQAMMDELLAGEAQGFDLDYDFPPIGADFAEEVHLICAAPS